MLNRRFPFGHCNVCPSIFWPLQCLSFYLLAIAMSVLLSFGHCVVCPSIYSFWLPLWYLQTFSNQNKSLEHCDSPYHIYLHCLTPDWWQGRHFCVCCTFNGLCFMYVLLHCGCARSPLLLILPLNFSSLPV